MPEATMNEDDSAAAWKYEIGIAGKIASVQSVAEAKRMNEPPNDKLRLGIFRANQ
jgi:hypothetical protein